MLIKTADDALKEMKAEAAAIAYHYLEDAKPRTLAAIKFLVIKGWGGEDIIWEITQIYGITEERNRAKIKIVVNALLEERNE